MVIGTAALHARLQAIPAKVREEVRLQLEKEAENLVSQMNTLKPIPEITIGWTWGEAPAGAVTIGRVGQNETARVAVTIYATGMVNGKAFAALAGWFEFGTKDRRHKSGKRTGRITASPYFYPVYRSNRTRIRSALSRAVTRGVRKA